MKAENTSGFGSSARKTLARVSAKVGRRVAVGLVAAAIGTAALWYVTVQIPAARAEKARIAAEMAAKAEAEGKTAVEAAAKAETERIAAERQAAEQERQRVADLKAKADLAEKKRIAEERRRAEEAAAAQAKMRAETVKQRARSYETSYPSIQNFRSIFGMGPDFTEEDATTLFGPPSLRIEEESNGKGYIFLGWGGAEITQSLIGLRLNASGRGIFSLMLPKRGVAFGRSLGLDNPNLKVIGMRKSDVIAHLGQPDINVGSIRYDPDGKDGFSVNIPISSDGVAQWFIIDWP